MFQTNPSRFSQIQSPKNINQRGELLLSAIERVVAFDKLNQEELQAYQFEKLKSLVSEAYHNAVSYTHLTLPTIYSV